MKKTIIYFMMLVLGVTTTASSWAEKILLKNNKTIYGMVKNRVGDIVWIDIKVGDSAGAIGVNINEVSFIYNDDGNISKFSPKSKEEFISELTTKLIEDVAKLRHLELKNKIQSDIMTSEEIKNFLSKRLFEYNTEEEIKSEEKVLKRLGLAEQDFDYLENFKQFSTRNVMGFYDDIDKKLYISASIPEQFRLMIIPHETIHALQDQNFDLQKFLPKDTKNADFELARTSLAEGDATVSAIDYELHQQDKDIKTFPDIHNFIKDTLEIQIKQNPAFAKYPTFLKEITLFPYLQGASFVQKILQNYSYDKLNEIFKDPPNSSEQIIHPEKYLFEKDEPMQIEVTFNKKSLPVSFKEIYQDSWGEYVIYNFLKAHTNLLEAKLASEGWGGDKIFAYENQETKEIAIFWFTAWDTEKDAEEFFNIYKQTLGKRYSELKQIALQNQPEEIISTIWDTDKGKVYMILNGLNAIIIEGIRLENEEILNLVTMESKKAS